MTMSESKKRPGGITVLSVLLAWLAIAGALNAWFIFSGDSPDLGPAFGLVALVYALSALAACIGLWRMAPWALRALHTWMVICLLIFAGLAYTFEDFIRGGIPGLVGFSLFIGLFFLGIHRFVQTKLSPDASAGE